MRRNENIKGFGLIEIVIVTAIMAVAFFGFLQAGITSIKLLRNERENLESSLLAKEAMEAVRSARDESWTTNIVPLTNGVNYYPVVENSKWKLTQTSPGLINGKYNRYVFFDQVFRDGQDKISLTGTLDINTRKITARATTTAKTTELVTYITNFQASLGRQTETKTIYFEDAPTDIDLANFPSNNSGDGDPIQSFTTVAAIQASKIEIYLKRAATSPSNIYAEIRSSPTGIILGTSNTITSSTISNTGLFWVEFRFSNSVSLSAATQYYIRLRSTPASTDVGSGSQGTIHWGYRQTASSPYPGGVARRYVGRLSNPNDAGQLLDQYDFGFRIYSVQ